MATRHVSINDGEHRRQQRKWRKHSASNKNTEPNRSSGTSFLSLSSIPDFKRSMSAEISFSCFFSCSLFCRSDASCSFSSWKQNVFVFFQILKQNVRVDHQPCVAEISLRIEICCAGAFRVHSCLLDNAQLKTQRTVQCSAVWQPSRN